MLGLAEKIQLGFSTFVLVVVLALVAFYVFLGIKPTAVAMLPGVIERASKEGAAPGGDDAGGEESSPSSGVLDNRLVVENHNLLRKLEVDQGVRARRIERKAYQVPSETFAYIKEPKHWLPELDKAGSLARLNPGGKGTLLEITSIEDDSLLKKFGFEEGDTLALFNGEMPPEFDARNSRALHELASKSLKALESGAPFTITVIRNGQPVHIEFKL